MSQKRKTAVSLMTAAILVISSVAMADEHEDTGFNYGYDEGNQLLVINTWSTEGDFDCTLQTSETATEYTVAYVTSDGVVEVDGLTNSEGSEVTFPPTQGDGDPADYETAEDCQLEALEVAGPQGQINHGMFMKAFNQWYDGPRRGCVNRYLAQSDFGKKSADQQVTTAEAREAGPVEVAESGTVEFLTALADCEKDNGDAEAQGNGNGKAKGKNKDKGRPDSPGKSGDAPGRNRP